jgi:hypothetical protein
MNRFKKTLALRMMARPPAGFPELLSVCLGWQNRGVGLERGLRCRPAGK